ncbi:conserved hypothetical protein [Lebetimonas natsushimae]|uniref:Glycosyl transferase family 1 domain-containing protein n=1 Tax=Lebetimonas natsushimae TaxID=1936991 RepID=A0A292Y7Y5_9BACT|nr:glycosyltransferase family 4 protein [Lebetimonas natsushimae]GAX86872.1 conserved hypothetical protein [Lebetimonas natsushimae]
MKEKYKLLIVARDIVNTGGGHVIEQLCKNLINYCDEIVVFTDYKNSILNELEIKQITSFYGEKLYNYNPKRKVFKIIRHFLRVSFFAFSTLKLKNKKFSEYIILDNNNEGFICDISLTHDVFTCTLLKDVKKNKRKIKRIFNPVLLFKIVKEWIVLNKNSTKFIIAISNETLKEINFVCKKKKKPKKVIGHGVDLEKFYPNEKIKKNLRKKYNIPNEKFVLLLSGHDYERKGLEYVIKALKLLPDDIILVVTGKGDIEPYLALAKKLSVYDRVYYLGLLNDVREGYWLSDVFVLPTSYEGWGLVATEAMGCGLPVLISKVGGVKDYLIDGYNGLAIERDEYNIAKKVLYIKNNQSIYNNIRKNGIETAKKYNWENVAKKYLEVIKFVGKQKNV